ncbi:MAG: hypothetical protein ACRDRN_24335 [Sciscionella sp.]
MPDEQTTAPATEASRVERDLLYLLVDPSEHQPLWSIPDLGRELEEPIDVSDAVNGLHRAGLIHRTSDGFVFASRAGIRATQMTGLVI